MDAIETRIGTKLARQIAGSRHFDLDDIGAKLGKLIAAEWTSQHIGQVEDAHAGQKSAHRPSATPVSQQPICIMAGRGPAMITSFARAARVSRGSARP